MNTNLKRGSLYLIPSLLGDSNSETVLPVGVKQKINLLKEFIVENEKSARKFLKDVGITTPQSELIIHEIEKHSDRQNFSQILSACENGIDIGLISEAGAPAVADPGANVVQAAHKKNIPVIPLVGPSAILLALMASGMNGQQFSFHGYLPIDKLQRDQKLKQLERESQTRNQTQIFIETPYRNNAMIDSILRGCTGETQLCIACDITLPTEFISTKKISDWKKSIPDLHKRPAVFVIYSGR